MTPRKGLAQTELVYQINTHLLYELKWLIFAADKFQQGGESYVAHLDSATVHARNLFEWASKPDATRFTLKSLGGQPVRNKAWHRWANNRVTHIGDRESDKAPWPKDGGGWDDDDKLMRMTKVALDCLRQGLGDVPKGPVHDAFERVLSTAEAYWQDPSPANHQKLAALYDGSRDQAYPN